MSKDRIPVLEDPELDLPWLEVLRKVSLLCLSITAFLALIGLCGWIFDLPALTYLVQGWSVMKFNTALCLLLLSGSELGFRKSVRWQQVSTVICLFVGCLASAVFLQHLLGMNFQVDDFIWPADLRSELEGGRMSAITSFCLVLIAYGIWAQRRPRIRAFAQGVLVAACTLSSLALIGYFYGVEALKSYFPYNTVSIHSAAALFFLCLGVLFENGREGLLRPFSTRFIGSWALRRFFPMTALVIVGIIWLIVKGVDLGIYDPRIGLCLRLVSTLAVLFALMLKISRWMNSLDQERARSHEELKASDQRTRFILESVPQMVWLWNVSGQVTYGNRAWRDFSGLEPAMEQESWDKKNVHPEDYPSLRRKHLEAMRLQRPYELEYRLSGREEKEYRRCLRRAVPLPNSHNGEVEWIATCTDMEDLRRLETEEAAAKLRAELSERETRQKTEFLMNMSHEIRTPLQGVIGAAEILSETSLDANQRNLLSTLRFSVDTLRALVSDILDIGKIESGKMELENSPFSLEELLSGLESTYRLQAAKKRVEFRLIRKNLPAAVRGDSHRLRQVLTNLVTNALKFTFRGNVTVEAEADVEGSVAKLKFLVKDTGIGISESGRSKLFQAFSQLDASTTRKFGGSGLGLKICRDLVQLMGGTIHFRSREGAGSEFWFTLRLPLAEGSQDILQGQNYVDFGFRPRVLVAEDNDVSQMVVTRHLESLGCEVLCVESGDLALEAVGKSCFDLVLMDCQMPVVDGYMATRRMRALGFKQPIVALTANASEEDRRRCLAAGMDDYFAKPFHREKLVEMLQRWIPSRRLPPILEEVWNSPGGQSTVKEVLRKFGHQAPERIRAVGDAIAARDGQRLAEAAFLLKTSALDVGAVTIGELCQELERVADRQEFDGTLQVEELTREFRDYEQRYLTYL